jgi:hypothetical protein
LRIRSLAVQLWLCETVFSCDCAPLLSCGCAKPEQLPAPLRKGAWPGGPVPNCHPGGQPLESLTMSLKLATNFTPLISAWKRLITTFP